MNVNIFTFISEFTELMVIFDPNLGKSCEFGYEFGCEYEYECEFIHIHIHLYGPSMPHSYSYL